MKVSMSLLAFRVGIFSAIGLLPARGQDEVFEEFGLIQSRFEPLGRLVNPHSKGQAVLPSPEAWVTAW